MKKQAKLWLPTRFAIQNYGSNYTSQVDVLLLCKRTKQGEKRQIKGEHICVMFLLPHWSSKDKEEEEGERLVTQRKGQKESKIKQS